MNSPDSSCYLAAACSPSHETGRTYESCPLVEDPSECYLLNETPASESIPQAQPGQVWNSNGAPVQASEDSLPSAQPSN
ncbi:hypothetical protein GF389_01415 [Candidatus Dojkabacteria bacterium]|nr:hypothetical protein [Candidatus Dojkabacteria bacterium]